MCIDGRKLSGGRTWAIDIKLPRGVPFHEIKGRTRHAGPATHNEWYFRNHLKTGDNLPKTHSFSILFTTEVPCSAESELLSSG